MSLSRLKRRAAIGLRVGKVIGRFKVGKLFALEIKDRRFRFWRNEERIERESALDGFYVIRSSESKADRSAEDTVRAYKSLSKVERAFRSMKVTHLQVRPVRHWTENRFRSHIFLCMLAYYVQWHMEAAWKSLLFYDEEIEAANARKSPVKPAERSLSAQWKDETKRTLDGEPAHSFRTLLRDLETIARNKVCTPGTEHATFDVITQPTQGQLQAFKLLGIPLPTAP